MLKPLLALLTAVLGVAVDSVTTAPVVPQGPGQTDNWFADAPTGDLSLDQLFPPNDTTPPAQPAPAAPATPAPATTPAAAPAPTSIEDFLRTQTGTVYKTREDAIKGLEHKDQLIEKLRQQHREKFGVDPITGEAARQATTPAAQSYLEGDTYFEDLLRSIQSGDRKSYAQTQAKFVNEVIGQALGPLAPVIQRFAQTNAVDTVSSEIKDFRTFRETPVYAKTLDEFPDLKQAISLAEQDPRYADKLAGYYKLAYRAAYGAQAPDLVRAAQTAPAPSAPAPVRPSMTSTPATPPQTSAAKPSLATSEGRKALIAELEARGIGDLQI